MKNYILSYEKYSVINKLPNIHQGLGSIHVCNFLSTKIRNPSADLKYSSPPIRNLHICAIRRVAAASEGQYVRCVSAAQYVKTTNSGVEQWATHKFDNQKKSIFSKRKSIFGKNEINIPSTNRKRVISNLGPILHRFLDTVQWLIGQKITKIASSYQSQSHKSPSLRVIPFQFPDEPDISKNYNVLALRRWRNLDASSLRFDTYWSVTDGRTSLLWLYQCHHADLNAKKYYIRWGKLNIKIT